MVTLDEYESYMRAVGRSANTIRVRSATVRLLCDMRELKDPAAMTRSDVIAFLGRNIMPWSRLTYWSALRAWGDYVRKFIDPTFDPMAGIPKPRTPDGVARPVTDKAVVQLLDARVHWKTRAYILLALYQGLRVHEIAKIRAEDVDVVAGWMLILGKGGTHRPVPIHPEVAAMAIATLPRRGYWFPSPTIPDKPVRAASVSRTIADAMEKAGVHATAHRLRDTSATQVQRLQHDIRTTQAFLRHKSVVSTQKYVDVDNAALEDAVHRLSWKAA